MSSYFGLHVGRTNCSVAVTKGGSKPDVVANDAGDRVTPCVVCYSSEETAVGLPAKQGLFRNMSSTVVKCLEFFNWDPSKGGLDEIKRLSVCPTVVKNDKISFEITKDEKTLLVSSDEVLVEILKKLNDIATHYSDADAESRKAVISVPLFYTTEQRQRIWKAAQEAGFEVLQAITAPAASLLAYGVGQTSRHESSTCLIYRCGGSTLDVTIVKVNGGLYNIVSTVHRKQGGERFTTVVADFLASEFRNKWKLDPKESKRSMFKLRAAAEDCKHVLSTLATAHCFVESLHEGVDMSFNVTRARMEMLIAQLMPEFIDEPIDAALQEAGLSSNDIKQVIVTGGTAKMPKIQQAIKEALPNSELLSTIPPDEVIAVGCSSQASIIGEPWDTACDNMRVSVQTISKDISVKCGDEDESENVTIFTAHTPLSSRFSLPVPLGKHHHVARLDVYEEAQLLAKLTLSNLPEAPSVAANFHLGSDGTLHVTLTEKMTGVSTSATISTAVAV